MLRRVALACAVLAAAALAFVGFFTNHSYVTTPSMYPTIPPGSMIFVSPASHYHVGQVIEFRANGLVWAHRLVKITPAGDFITKGDNPMNAPDVFVPPVTQRDVIGVVTHSVPWIGFPELLAHRPAYGLAWLRAELGLPGRILLVGFVALVSLSLAAVTDSRVPRESQARHRRRSARAAAVVVEVPGIEPGS